MKDVVPDPLKDQFFLIDPKVIQKIVEFADLTEKDTVLEIGAGTGNLTREIAKKAGRVITFEIDTRFKPYLRDVPKNVDLRFENAWEYVQLHGKFRKKKEYNKVVANPPYSFIEPFLHNLTFLEYDKVIMVVPLKTLKTIKSSPIFSVFFDPQIKMRVTKTSFDPVPNTNSCVIELVKLPNPLETKDLNMFLKQYMYQHERQLPKNALMEGLIKYNRKVNNVSMTKNQAREVVRNMV